MMFKLLPRRLFWTVNFIAVMLLSSRALRAQNKTSNGLSNVTITQKAPKPSSEQYDRWLKKLFETDELWRFKDKKEFYSILDKTVTDTALKNKLKKLFKTSLSLDEILKTKVFYDIDDVHGFLFIPAKIRSQVPKSLVEAVYAQEMKNFNSGPIHFIPFYNINKAEAFIDFYFPKTARQLIRDNTIFLNNKYLILITPHTWEQLPKRYRQEVISSYLKPSNERVGLEAKLTIHKDDDLATIAKEYAGERDYRPIERYLKMKLGSSESTEVPLENILHPFIRKMIDTFSECHGPNCYNSGLNVNRSYHYKIEHVPDETSLMKEIFSKYRFVKPNEPLQPGDLLVYLDEEGMLEHVISYADANEDLVFTKNGLNKFNPYIFQKMSETEKIYFPDGKFQLMAFRVSKNGENPLTKEEYYFGKRIFYKQNIESNTNCIHQTIINKLIH